MLKNYTRVSETEWDFEKIEVKRNFSNSMEILKNVILRLKNFINSTKYKTISNNDR